MCVCAKTSAEQLPHAPLIATAERGREREREEGWVVVMVVVVMVVVVVVVVVVVALVMRVINSCAVPRWSLWRWRRRLLFVV